MAEQQRDRQQHERGEQGRARRQPVYAINQVEGVGDADGPQDRERAAEHHRQMHRAHARLTSHAV